MQEFTLAVLGSAGSGKSTLVQYALDLEKLPVSPKSVKKISLEGTVSILRLIELRLEDLEIDDDFSIRFSLEADNQNQPRIDGALMMCDVTSSSSISCVPSVLSKFLYASYVYFGSLL